MRYEKMYMDYSVMAALFSKHESQQPAPNSHIIGYIRFKNGEWFDWERTEDERTFRVTSDNKAYQSRMGGFSIFADGIDAYKQRTCMRIDSLIYPAKYDLDWEDTIECCWIEVVGE